MILLSNGGDNTHRLDARPDAITIGTVDGVAMLRRADAGWQLGHKALDGCFVSAVTQDAGGTLFAATHGIGVARSRDGGESWEWVNNGIDRHDLWSARAGRLQGKDVVLVGSLPAHLYISEDAGGSWRELTALRDVPGVEQWCFPPPPRVGHVKDIVIDGERLFAGIEIGALLVSTDFGDGFRDLHIDPNVQESDVHRILLHPERPHRIIVANGLVGVLTSDDDGKTWRKNPMPAEANYPDPIVLHPDKPDTIFLTAGVGWPPHWYKLGRARGKMFRSRDAGQRWKRLMRGLPNGQRATFGALTIATWPGGCGLYAADTDGQIFESLDEGETWCIVADVAPVSKGEFYRGLRKDRVMLASVDDVEFNATAAARIGATKIA
jgi:Sortilin, neurotensin receptor 3,